MDLIYSNSKKEDIGVLLDYSFDLAFGTDENNFQLTLPRNQHCCEAGYFIYIEGTEYGGVIDSIEVKTDSEEVIYKGRTWHGIFEKKILCPDSGNDYLIVSGEANAILRTLITRTGLSYMFKASTVDSLLNITSYQFDRYTDAYNGIRKMLRINGYKLLFTLNEGMVELSAVPIIDYSQEEQFDSDQVSLDVEKIYTSINHVVCLGKGDLKDRQVIHLYADSSGNISKIQSITGINEIVSVYDYPNAENIAELEQGGIEILEEAIAEGTVNMSFDAETTIYDIDDIVGTKDIVTGIEVTDSITKKIVTINKGKINIEYKVG